MSAARACEKCLERDCPWPHDYCACICHGPFTPEEMADLEWESGFALAEQQLETELAEMRATTRRLNRLAARRRGSTA